VTFVDDVSVAYGKKCVGVAGRRRLVAQPGGLTLGFAQHLVYIKGYLKEISRQIGLTFTAYYIRQLSDCRCRHRVIEKVP